MLCKECNEPLAKVTFSGGESYICLNWRCCLYRQPQMKKLKRVILKHHKTPGKFRSWAHYRQYLAERSRNYHALSDLGFDYKFCGRFKSNKQTERIEGLVRRGLSVKYITKMIGDGHG